MLSSRYLILLRVVVLPLLLVLATGLGLGSYYEASDDTSIAWLFSGVLATAPVPTVALYFHGNGRALAALYAAAPGMPWFGLLLGSLLLAATMFGFAVLERLLRPRLRPGWLAVALVLFFVGAWLEHWLWFSYVRVALLLAGTAVLYAAQRARQGPALLLGALGLAAAWLMRPSLAQLGFAATLPAVLLLAGSWRRALPVVAGGALLLAVGTVGAGTWRTPAQAHTQALDGYLARILDFDQLRPAPRTALDSLGTAAVGQWLLGDSTIVNEALCRRAYRFEAADFFGREVPAKIGLRLGLLGRDYFPLLLALAATAWGVRPARRGWFGLVQLGFAGGLLLFAGLLKLPPRLALPLLDFWLLTNLALVFEPLAGRAAGAGAPAWPPAGRRGALVLAGVAGLLYLAKTGHRYQVLRQEQARHETTLAAIDQAGAGRVRVLAGTNDLLKSLSPFRSYAPSAGPVLMLTGWPSHDASQSRLRRALSGTADQTECLRRLATAAPPGAGPPPLWVLSDEAAAWLRRRFARAGRMLPLRPGAYLPADSALRYYRAQP